MPSDSRVGRVQVKFADGKELTLAIHGIRQLDVFGVFAQQGIKNYRELTDPESSLQAVQAMVGIVAIALSFPNQKGGEFWTAERIYRAFADPNEILKAFNKCMELSDLPKAPDASGSKRSIQKHGPYG